MIKQDSEESRERASVAKSSTTIIENLETKLAFMEDALDTLSNEFYSQQKTIDALVLKVKQLQDKVSTIDDASEQGEIADERPPHY